MTNRRPRILVDNKIPFIEGRLDACADVSYLAPEEFTPETVRDADGLIIRTRTKCNAALLDGSKVKFIATATIGKDHIDLEYCRQKGITARNAVGCNAPGVAQYVWSFLLRNGFTPGKSKLGIVGYGAIGSIVGEWARQTDTPILICDPPRAENGFTDIDYKPLDDVLRECDAVTFHTPLTFSGPHKTYHMIGKHELDLMKPGVILINAARGGVVEESALIEAIKSKRLTAIVDVWEGEPEINRELLEMAHGATQHIAGYSHEGKIRATRMSLDAVEEFFGIECDKSGLEAPEPGVGEITPQMIIESFDPREEMDKLRKNPENFEILRETYKYRHEVLHGV